MLMSVLCHLPKGISALPSGSAYPMRPPASGVWMSKRRCSRLIAGKLCLIVWVCVPVALATEEALPLHAQIDRLIDHRLQELKIAPAQPSSDAEYVRRVFLDLNGVIPTAAEARSFIEATSPDKRQQLIAKLLARPDYALHMARVFDVMLTERRIPTIKSYDLPATEWRQYLAESFAENKPWDQLVRELLASDGVDTKPTAAVKFYLVRDVEPHQLTRDTGRLFLGTDLQCARCHDDPRFDEYRQADYYGIYAFVQRLKVFPLTPRGAAVSELAEGKSTFTSVFTAQSGETNPRLPGGEMLADPAIDKGMEYVVKPGPKERGVPTYSRRLKLAQELPRTATRGFARNLANRLWALMFGRGLVHPLDLHHAENPPSHPELLDRLEAWVVEHDYDVKALLGQIALSQAYQRSSVLPDGDEEIREDTFAVAMMRGLTPEQMRWSWLQATGRIEAHYSRLNAATQKQPAESAESTEPTPAWKSQLARNEALERQSDSLLEVFAGLPGSTDEVFQPTVDQALYLRNSVKLLPLLNDGPGTLLAKLTEMSDALVVAEELYLAVLARKPTEDETALVVAHLTDKATLSERRELLQALQWGLLLSAEFRLNH